MTLNEINLEYRTATVGSLSVNGSIYMAARFAIPQITFVYGTGLWIGDQLTPPVQTYAPTLWDGLGASINWVVDILSAAFASEDEKGAADQESSQPFELGNRWATR